jgi:hypothetical protein
MGGADKMLRCPLYKKIVPQKLNVILFFDMEFFQYFFRVLPNSSWLKFCSAFQRHSVYLKTLHLDL